MKPGRKPQPPPAPIVNVPTVKYSSANAVSKSDLPRPPVNAPLTAKDVTSPAFIEKVVEILNGDNDRTSIIQSLPVAGSNPPVASNNPTNDKSAPLGPGLPNKAPNSQEIAKIQQILNGAKLGNPLTPSFANQPNNGVPIRPNPQVMGPVDVPKQQNIPMLPPTTLGPEGR